MIQIAGGILLALIFLLCVPFLLRGIAGILTIAALLIVGAFLFGTAPGRMLLPAVVLFGAVAAAVALASKMLDRRDARKRAKATWHLRDN
jgi:polyferredoxin